MPGDRLLVTRTDTKTLSFSLKLLFKGCILASQTGLAAESCTLLYTGVKNSGARVNTTPILWRIAEFEQSTGALLAPVIVHGSEDGFSESYQNGNDVDYDGADGGYCERVDTISRTLSPRSTSMSTSTGSGSRRARGGLGVESGYFMVKSGERRYKLIISKIVSRHHIS